MTIGQRLKQARLEAGLSQRQLCGDTITRNMLSLIENGSARPSMDTLTYLAGRLGKSVSYFLEESAVLSANQSVMEAARQAFAEKRYSAALAAMQDYQGPDAVFDWEKALLLAHSRMELARQAMADGRLPYARSLLEEAARDGEQTPYFDMSSLALLRAKLQPELAESICVDEALLLKAEAALATAPERAAALLDAMDGREFPRWKLLRGKAAMAAGQYAAALPLLHGAEVEGFREVAPALEVCYRELGDFRMAYEYACRQRAGAVE